MKQRKKWLVILIALILIAANIVLLAMFSKCVPGQKSPEPVVSDSSAEPVSSSELSENTALPELALNSYNVGEVLVFGHYEQDGDPANGAEPVEWLVLDKSERGLFVISKYGLTPVQFHWNNTRYPKHITYEESNIRLWLNTVFPGECFSEAERNYIMLTHNTNDDSSRYETKGGRDTDDFVFFLSHDEVLRYFPERGDRLLYATAAAVNNGAYSKEYCLWWLRTPGAFQCNAEYVFDSGDIYAHGSDVGHDNVCARPAMWLSFDPEPDTQE